MFALRVFHKRLNSKTSSLICETLGVVKRTPKSQRPTHNYPKMAVVNNLPQNINILETFDDNELLKRYRL